MFKIRNFRGESDRNKIAELLENVPSFTRDEKEVAMELVDVTINNPNIPTSKENDGYKFLLATLEIDNLKSEVVVGYICYGATAMTSGTYDLFWIATHSDYLNKGIARSLIVHMLEEIKSYDGRLVRVETSGQELYKGVRDFYLKLDFIEEARIKDFYKIGDDLVIYTYRIL
ncbi:MAG: GNAT family N-acetyltransferase [Oligoflexia bacterium]|nr:GNAT family N-acetyltransferase [Oligoflexia bacterium]